ncbi:hypothetical protein M9H77_24081 [Catharanthus roseus]|uniref:Uncharacterized protein n=1 Tax=Catharanthus roseus TaxID=4058 RepID=A0ACC0AXV3_CATRO|nr:hypothetical protein M9H77_24081 [Catharanthus roseus]
MEWENAWAGNPNLPNPSNDMSNKEYTDALLDVGQVLVGMRVGVAKQEQEGSGNSFGVEESLRNLSPIDIDTLDKDMAAQDPQYTLVLDGLYGHLMEENREASWQLLKRITLGRNLSCICGGDFMEE